MKNDNEDSEDNEVYEIFKLFDKDYDDTIYSGDLLNVVKALGIMLTPDNLKLIEDFEDEVKDNKITIDDFLGLYEQLNQNRKSKSEEQKELFEAFAFFDSEPDLLNKGYINKDYFKRAITSFGNKLTEEEFESIMADAIYDKTNKKFDYQSFVKTILNKK